MLTHCPTKLFQKKPAGTSLGLVVALLVMLTGFLGIAVYTGLTAYLQNELQKAVSTATQIGANAIYDGSTTLAPTRSVAKAIDAASRSFENIVNQSLALRQYNVAVTTLPTLNDSNVMRMAARVTVPTPFLSLVGINNFVINASAAAQYGRFRMTNPVAITPLNGPPFKRINLSYPLVDAPGPDLFLRESVTAQGGLHGYLVEACSANECYDIGSAARLMGAGLVMDRQIGGRNRRVIYGDVFIDLGALGPGYDADVRKATSLRIIDDGVYDQYNPTTGQRTVELIPQPTALSFIDLYHYAITCAPNGFCTQPPGFQPGV